MILRPPSSPLFPYTTLFRSLPELPSIKETLPAYEVTTWYSLVAPKDMPPDIVARLNRTLAEIVQAPDMQKKLRSEEHTSELQSRQYLVCRPLLEKKKTKQAR